MRYLPWLVIGAILGISTVAGGQTTRPGPMPTVMIFPFRQLGDTSAHGWIGAALRDQLTAVVFGSNALRALPGDGTLGAAEPDAALAAAQSAQADMVVFGSYQVASDTLRVNGNVEDVRWQRSLGTLQATGKIADFFKIEDSLTQQFRSAVPVLNPQAYGNAGPPGTVYPSATAPVPPYPDSGAYIPPETYYGGDTSIYPYVPDYGVYPFYDMNVYPWGYGDDYLGFGFYGGGNNVYRHRGEFNRSRGAHDRGTFHGGGVAGTPRIGGAFRSGGFSPAVRSGGAFRSGGFSPAVRNGGSFRSGGFSSASRGGGSGGFHGGSGGHR